MVIVPLPIFNDNLSLTSHSLKVRGHIDSCFCLKGVLFIEKLEIFKKEKEQNVKE
jgi:hypothetical protein